MLISALLLIVFGIIAVYLGAANLYKYMWWLDHYNGEHTDEGMWTESAVMSYIIWGLFFVITGVLGILSGLILFFRGLPAVAEDNRSYLRRTVLPMAIIGWIPSPGLFICGFLLTLVWMMYNSDRFDMAGLLLEDVSRTRRPGMVPGGPTPVGATDQREAYATGYAEQSLYTDDYAQAQYGGGTGTYTADTGGGSLLEAEYAEPAMPAEPEPAAPVEAPMCPSCGKPTEWIEEYNRYYCYDCDAYV